MDILGTRGTTVYLHQYITCGTRYRSNTSERPLGCYDFAGATRRPGAFAF